VTASQLFKFATGTMWSYRALHSWVRQSGQKASIGNIWLAGRSLGSGLLCGSYTIDKKENEVSGIGLNAKDVAQKAR